MQSSRIARDVVGMFLLALAVGVSGCAYRSLATGSNTQAAATAREGNERTVPASGATANCRWIVRPVLGPKGGTTFTYERVCSLMK